jgi:peptide/nickel transport system substrate-binding protein
MFLLAPVLFGAEELLIVPGITGHTGGILAYAQRNEPKSFNPAVVSADLASREVLHRIHADLIHINRETLQTEPALAKSWTASSDGLHYVLELRHGIRFSDGQPFDADDVVFSFGVYLDPKVDSPQRDLLILDGKPIVVRKIDAYRVAFDLPSAYAVAERLFDGFAILPRHLLEKPWREGKLPSMWTLRTPPSEMAGLGPFQVKECVPGQRIVLTRNNYYWKSDNSGHRLPYLDEIDFSPAGSEDGQTMRFQAGESDILNRISARNFAVIEKERERRGFQAVDAGAGMEYNLLFFNQNEVSSSSLPEVAAHQVFLRRIALRRAINLAIDRDALIRLVYQGHASTLAGPVTASDKKWLDAKLPAPARNVPEARRILAADHFGWTSAGALRDPDGHTVEFSLITSSGAAERVQMATMIQDDLKQALGISIHVVPLDLRSLLDRVQRTHDYDACLLTLVNADADPNPNMGAWLSSGPNHLWNPGQKSPATSWEAEIDTLMRRQLVTQKYAERKRLYDRVQELLAQNLPFILLVNPHVLVAARPGLANFRPAVLDHYTLWNVEALSWRQPAGAHQ